MPDAEGDKKIHVEIKPISNGNPPMSASVDELRATIEGMSLSPLPFPSVSIMLVIIASKIPVNVFYLIENHWVSNCILRWTFYFGYNLCNVRYHNGKG